MTSINRVKFTTGEQQLVEGEGKTELAEEGDSEWGRAEESRVACEDMLSRSAKQRVEGEWDGDSSRSDNSFEGEWDGDSSRSDNSF